MVEISFQVVDGVDKGRTFQDVEPPITIGREEGNTIRLNDERVSRFHAKIQEDHGQVVLTDLDSTNGTRVNGEAIQLRLLRLGDRVSIGRSTLVFGTVEQIESQAYKAASKSHGSSVDVDLDMLTEVANEQDLAEVEQEMQAPRREAPPIPLRLSPAQAAQLSEMLDFLHRSLADALESVHIPAGASEARIPLHHWHRLQAVQAHLARYTRMISEPQDGG